MLLRLLSSVQLKHLIFDGKFTTEFDLAIHDYACCIANHRRRIDTNRQAKRIFLSGKELIIFNQRNNQGHPRTVLCKT